MAKIQTQITVCEQKIGHIFSNKLICLEALQASGHPLIYDRLFQAVNKNDRLAALGDAVLKLVLRKKWFQTTHSNGKEFSDQS